MVPLARLLLRSESIASSKIEGMQVDARSLARAEVAQDTGRSIGSEAAEIIANIDAMQFAIERTAVADAITPDEFAGIHGVLMARAPNAVTAGRFRPSQNWIGGNDYNPCGAVRQRGVVELARSPKASAGRIRRSRSGQWCAGLWESQWRLSASSFCSERRRVNASALLRHSPRGRGWRSCCGSCSASPSVPTSR
jgi:hypothetical protein